MNIKIMCRIIFLMVLTLFSQMAAAASCGAGSGAVIIDNTATPAVVAIGANLGFRCSGKNTTAIVSGYGGNAINISDFDVLARKQNTPMDQLQLFIGKSNATVSEFNYGTANQFDLFAAGKHLFDLDRLRVVSDWISNNVTPDAGVTAGTYGTITLNQFLANIAAGKTMYGMVRVLVPLEAGQSSSTLNALKTPVPSGSLYGFCSSTSAPGCSCSPGSSASFGKIEAGVTLCGNAIPANAKIKVKGGLFWDFVDGATNRPLDLAELSFVPRELYFKVTIPIMVNWAHDLDDNGAMDNMDLAKAYITGYADTDVVSATYLFADVPQESKDQYQFETGTALTQALFDALDPATRYHMMLPSGYADGWAAAFDKLNITAADWSTIPGMAKPFRVPTGVTGVMTANDVRTEGFEDIPTYLYSGGLIDMHSHVNVSGLVYVPQGMELEAKDAGISRQYVSGAIIVRDSFFIEAKSGTITVISSDPLSYSTVRRTPPSATTSSQSNLSFSSSAFDNSGGSGGGAGSSNTGGSGGGAGGTGSPGKVNWQEIRPQL